MCTCKTQNNRFKIVILAYNNHSQDMFFQIILPAAGFEIQKLN